MSTTALRVAIAASHSTLFHACSVSDYCVTMFVKYNAADPPRAWVYLHKHSEPKSGPRKPDHTGLPTEPNRFRNARLTEFCRHDLI